MRFALAGRVALAAALSLIGLEAAGRVTRVADVPLYNDDPAVGFVPKPNQRGAFLWTHDWAFNELSMATPRPFKPEGVGLVGDSVVCGGNPLRQADRLASRLEARIRRPVWPMCSGSWSLANELAYIRAHPQVLQLDTIVFVVNRADFGQAAGWLGSVQQPLSPPPSAVYYGLQRKFAAKPGPRTADLKPWRPALAEFLKNYRGRVVFALYPVQWGRGAFIPPAALPGSFPVKLSPSEYRDQTHPTAAGTADLADQIASRL